MSVYFKVLVCCIIFFANQCCAQRFADGIVRGEAMHHVSGPLSAWENPALTAGISEVIITAAVRRNFMVADFDQKALSLIIPAGKTIVPSFTFDEQGTSYYNEKLIHAGLSRKFIPAISAYVGGLGYYMHQSEDYGNVQAYGFRAALSGAVTSRLHIATIVEYPVSKEHPERLPKHITAGLGYNCSSLLMIEGSAIMFSGSPPDMHLGFYYLPSEKFRLRGGVLLQPFSGYLGCDIRTGKLCFDISVDHHPDLGLSPRVAVAYSIKTKQ